MTSPVFIPPDRFSALHAAATAARERLAGKAATAPEHDRLDRLVVRFGLSEFERDILLLAAGVEVDDELAPLLHKVDPDHGPGLSFALPLATLQEAHWSALSPDRPLRRWRLIEIAEHRPLARAAITIDERVLHHLAGLDPMDARVSPFVSPVSAPDWMPDSVHHAAQQIAQAFEAAPPRVIELDSDDPRDVRAVAARAAQMAGAGLWRIRAGDLPASAEQRMALAGIWQRETMLTDRALLIEAPEANCEPLILAASRLVLHGRAGNLCGTREREKISLPPLAPIEQATVWKTRLGKTAQKANGALDRVTGHFRLGLADAEEAAAKARHGLASGVEDDWVFWDAARSVSRPRLRDLATEMTARAFWKDLILPQRETNTLHAITAQIRQRCKVYDEWGFAREGTRGQGVSVLFSGPSGTGKTLAAEVLATELRLDLFRIDLSQVVNKYIGETEKNLAAVFDAAEDGGSILLFDEADALFGKRSEVKDSHDRYANMEVAYLLQRMESYRGLAILTTNFRSALDKAFSRRLRYIVDFPFPGFDERLAIWQRIFPAQADTDGVDPVRLAQLGVAGGAIRNIALNAAFLAAEDQSPITMANLGRAAESECAKIDKKIASAEIRGWT